MKTKKWYDNLWIVSGLYLILGSIHILFALLGLLCFSIPLLMSLFGGEKKYCNRYCGRGQLFFKLGENCHLSTQHQIPSFLRSKWFRYGFLIFFMAMFIRMLWSTYMVATGNATATTSITLFWVISIPWSWASPQLEATSLAWVQQFAYGFYSIMLTSTILGLLTMIAFRPRSWCVYCPMGTMTQCICKAKYQKTISECTNCSGCTSCKNN